MGVVSTASTWPFNISDAWQRTNLSDYACHDASINATVEICVMIEHQAVKMWDRPRMRQAWATAGYAQLLPLISRLKGGLPINVLVLGDSITEWHGGKFPPGFKRTSADGFLQDIIQDTSPFSPGQEIDPTAATNCEDVPLGYMRTFMLLINQSWPNTDHRLFNSGSSGLSLSGHVGEASCMHHLLPKRIDLIVLQHLPFLEPSDETLAVDAYDQLMHVMWSHIETAFPPTVFLNMLRMPYDEPGMYLMDNCIREQECGK
jgi:hypothetical protein